MTSTEVLIVGAGPTGLVLALWLTRQGIRVRIVDRAPEPGTTSRALAVQARTLELYRQLDLADAVVKAGHKNPAINLWVRGRRKAHLAFGDAGATLTPFPFVLIYPQDRHERLLIDRLARLGVVVDRPTELVDFEDNGERVVARLRASDGREELCEARFLAGCDGARSFTRRKLGTGFEGGTYDQVFYVADVETSGPTANGEIHFALESADFVALLAYDNDGRGRLIGTVRDERAEAADVLTFDDVSHRAIQSLGLHIDKVNWFSTYRVHHRVTDHYRRGSVFLLGDAAHVHSPAGGQGMNTGIGDAVNLAWKLAAVLRGRAPDGLLDTYEVERLAFARTLVATTDRLFSAVTAEGTFADFVRTRVAPIVAAAAYGLGPVREFLFRVVSQTTVHYRGSPLSHGSAGSVEGGDRLPWVAANGSDNYDALRDITWQIHIYGVPDARVVEWCATRGLPLHVFDWSEAHQRAGLARNALYLLRPDTYVAMVTQSASVAALEQYFDARGLGF